MRKALKIAKSKPPKAPKTPAKAPSFQRGYLNELDTATKRQSKAESNTKKSLKSFTTTLRKR